MGAHDPLLGRTGSFGLRGYLVGRSRQAAIVLQEIVQTGCRHKRAVDEPVLRPSPVL
jgi:hypothetical protein